MFSGGTRPTFARTRSPSAEGNPSTSSTTTATVVSPLRSTSARAVSSPRFSVVGFVGPNPPETGSNGSGVITRTAAPALSPSASAGVASSADRQMPRRKVRRGKGGFSGGAQRDAEEEGAWGKGSFLGGGEGRPRGGGIVRGAGAGGEGLGASAKQGAPPIECSKILRGRMVCLPVAARRSCRPHDTRAAA